MSSIGFLTTKLQHIDIQYDKHKSSGCPKEITVTLVIQTFFVSDSKLLCRQKSDSMSNYCADAKTFYSIAPQFCNMAKITFFFL